MKRLKIILIAILLAMIAALLSGCVVKAPIPDVKEERFNFSVTYEVDGEERTYSGVYVCEYDGVRTSFLGSGLEWKDRIENEKDVDIPIHTTEEGVIYINLGFFPDYFMGDPSAIYYEAPVPNLFIVYSDSTFDDMHISSDEEIIAELGVRLISYEYDEPIENTFEEKLSFSRFEPSIN